MANERVRDEALKPCVATLKSLFYFVRCDLRSKASFLALVISAFPFGRGCYRHYGKQNFLFLLIWHSPFLLFGRVFFLFLNAKICQI